MICAYYAFRSRKLPDNFNESRYIAFCVDTTLLIWLSFLPTYFITSRAYHKVLVMSSALIINATVNLICLFLIKLCALYKYRSEYRKNLLQEQELFRVIRSIASDNLDLHSANQKRMGPSSGGTGSVGAPLAQSQSCNNLQQQSLDVTLNTGQLCKSDSNLKATWSLLLDKTVYGLRKEWKELVMKGKISGQNVKRYIFGFLSMFKIIRMWKDE